MRAFGAETFRSLRGRNFRLFAIGQVISQTGTWMQMVAIGLLVLAITDSGVAVGVVTAVQFVPILLLGAWAGLLSDRSDRQRLLIVLNTVGAVAATAFALLVLIDRAELWSIYLLTLVAGTITALENPTRRAFVTDLVDDDDIANAVGLNSTLMTGSRIVGPAVAGALIAGPGIGWCFAAHAASHLPKLWLFTRMDRGDFRPSDRLVKAKGQLREGLRYVWATPELKLPLLLVASVGTLAFNFSVILPLFATRDLGGTATTYTALFSVMSMGSVVGALAVARRKTADTRFLALGSLCLAASMFALAAAPTTWAAHLLVLPVGLTSVMVVSGANAVVQLSAAPAMRGRVLALIAVVFLGSTPIGGPIAGAISEGAGARWALALGAATSLVAGVLTLRSLGRLDATPLPGGTVEPLPVEPVPVGVGVIPGR